MNRLGWAAFLIAASVVSNTAHADSDCNSETTQQGINTCTAKAVKAAEAALAAEYETDLKDIQPDRRALLKAAQQAWATYRDAQCALEASQFSGGTMQPFALATCRQRLAVERTRTLNELWHESVDK